MNATQQAIVRAAREAGIDPATALAFAARESSFNPQARSSKTIRGLFQMRGDLRAKYGVGDTDDPYAQAAGWGRFFRDLKEEMTSALGHDVSDAQAYAGHHFGGRRAARMMRMDPATPVENVFTATEMAANPHFAKAGTVGNLLASVTSDIDRRRASYGGQTDLPDLASFGMPIEPSETGPAVAGPSSAGPDLSSFGTLAEQQPADRGRSQSAAVDLSAFGDPA